MNHTEKIERITQHLDEVVGDEILSKIVEKRPLKIYWGTAPTGSPSLGYLVPLYKIADFLEAECEVTILIADIHAHLDNLECDWNILKARTEYYEFLIKEMLKAINVPLEKLRFVTGTSFQTSPEYTMDVYKLSSVSSVTEAKKSGAEVVKQSENPKLSGILYPLLQALDEEYLKVDAQFGGVDQRKIFMFAREHMPKIGYKKRIHLLNPLVPGLGKSGKMSSSEPDSKIDFYDSNKVIRSKINKAFSEDTIVEGNGLLALLQFVLFKYLTTIQEQFVINRPEQYGGTISFSNYQEVEEAFSKGTLSSIDLKQGVAELLIRLITPIREQIKARRELFVTAYPHEKQKLN